MSVCVMKKLTVLAPQRDADRLVRRLMRLRCAELSAVPLGDLPDGGTLLRYDCDTARAEAERRVAAVTAALTAAADELDARLDMVRERAVTLIVQSREEADADIEALKAAARDKLREAVKHIEWELTDI